MFYKKYKLDRFQEEAIRSIEKNHSVIVAAPTGAGKTLIAEYVIEKCIETEEQIIYTAPIKALSNQKYRDFSRDHGDRVGIVTGDVVINATAPTLIMTTEIFRNTIFDNPEQLKDVRYVIFDEIHFIDDVGRGTVWEESIIFAPQHVNFLCLSATIPNLEEFASWMRSVRRGRIDVVSETERPVPLEYKLHLKEHGLGWLDELREVQTTIRDQPVGTRRRGDRRSFLSQRPAAMRTKTVAPAVAEVEGLEGDDLIQHIQLSGQLPCLYFSFSRGNCEEKAMENVHRDLLNPEERETILAEYDQLCERYGIHGDLHAEQMRELVEHGVAYHHAGLLPTLKEVVERLFTLGYIKLLFTTETFALGINMPACTVVLDSLAKFDGVEFRPLKAREYHQMAGRAGRRGIDTRGYVYASVDLEFNEYDDVERIVSGDIERIESQFNLFYSSLMNLYARHGERIYQVCEKSLASYQTVQMLEQLDSTIRKAKSRQEEEVKGFECVRGGTIKDLWDYMRLREQGSGGLTEPKGEKRRMMRSMRCHGCRNLSNCVQTAEDIKGYSDIVSDLSTSRTLSGEDQRQQIESRLELLREMEYIDDGKLLPKGRFASQIFGYSLQATELFFNGYFHRLDPDLINVLMMAVVFESKRDCWYMETPEEITELVLQGPSEMVENIRLREEALGVDTQLKELDPSLSAATYAWSAGCAFEELMDYTNATPGDLVRYLRQANDLLRQTRRAASGDDLMVDRISECMARIDRDVVDAERQLRAG